jgi:hypothetical protein
MKTVKIVFGSLLAFLAFGFLINLAKAQGDWGTGRWTNAGRAHAGTMVAAMLISTLPFAIFFALSLFGSLALFKSAAANRTAGVIEVSFGILLLLIGFFMGLLSLDKVRSAETVFEGAFFVLLEAAAGILLLFLAFRSELLKGLAGKIIKVVLSVFLVLMALITLLALSDVFRMSRFNEIRSLVVGLLMVYMGLELAGAVTLLITAFKRRRSEPAPSLSIAQP